jgi:allantoinase
MAPLLETPIVHFHTLHEQPYTPPEELPTVLCSTNTILPGRRCTPATIVISPASGKIINVFAEILPASTFPPGTEYHDVSPKFLMPGLVDAHVHLNEPGWRTEWEGFETGTRAAAFGGVTTLIDMPLNAIPPTTTVENFNTKIKAAEGQCYVDVGFYGGVIPGNEDELIPLVEAGVRGFKCFLINSGVVLPTLRHLSRMVT